MMDHVEKERLALSVVIAAVIYVVFFLATGWLDILKPEGPPPYYGPLFVEIVPESTIDPVSIVKEDPIVFPKEEPVQVQSEPVIRAQTESQVELETQPVTQPEPEITLFAQETEVVTEPDTTIISPTDQNTEALPADERFDPGPSGEADLPTSTFTAQSTSIAGEPTDPVEQATDLQTVESQQTVPVIETNTVGTDEAVSDTVAETGTSEFTAVTAETPTDQYGTDRIIYGDSESATESDAEITATATTGDVEENSLLNQDALDRVDAALEGTGDGNGTGTETGNGTDRTGQPEVEGSVAETSELPFEIEAIDAVDSALVRQRVVMKYFEAVLPDGFTLEGQTRLEVPVLFTIESTGLISNVDLEYPSGSGYSVIDVAIKEAIRKWKFEPVKSEQKVRVRLKYVITAE